MAQVASDNASRVTPSVSAATSLISHTYAGSQRLPLYGTGARNGASVSSISLSSGTEAIDSRTSAAFLNVLTRVSTFKNAAEVRESMASVPLDKLMLETDAPFLAPVPYRGKRCEPAYVCEISEVAAETLGVTREALSEATCATARAFFKGLE